MQIARFMIVTLYRDYVFVGKVLEDTDGQQTLIEQRNKFVVGDTLELMKTDGSTHAFTVEALVTDEGDVVTEAPHPKQNS